MKDAGNPPAIKCADVDECSNPGFCGPNATCTNSPGNATCVCDRFVTKKKLKKMEKF